MPKISFRVLGEPMRLHRRSLNIATWKMVLQAEKITNLSVGEFDPAKHKIDLSPEKCSLAAVVEVKPERTCRYEELIKCATDRSYSPLVETTGLEIRVVQKKTTWSPIYVASWIPTHDTLPPTLSRAIWKLAKGAGEMSMLSRVDSLILIDKPQFWIFGIA